jgi:hypothetical protein
MNPRDVAASMNPPPSMTDDPTDAVGEHELVSGVDWLLPIKACVGRRIGDRCRGLSGPRRS